MPKKIISSYHSSEIFMQKVFDYLIPLALLYFYYQFYNFGKITPQELIKTTGLLAISLLSLTLIIGPLCRFLPIVENLKVHRKIWGITAFLSALIHTSLIFVYFYKFNLLKFIDYTNPKYLGIFLGLTALIILIVVTLTSNKKSINILGPKTWKLVQTTSYLALLLAFAHFYIIESVNGTLVIKRLVGQITFGFAGFAVLLRLFTLFF